MKNLFSLEGRTALITGGSRGIGAMIARGCNALAEKIQSKEKSLDILVNNAGAAWGAGAEIE